MSATKAWLRERICACTNDAGIYGTGFDWATMNHYISPPTCVWCGKWMRRSHQCAKCDEFFYEFFSHPRNGYHHTPLRGWYCWNCLEKYTPPVVSSAAALNRPKTPPPAMVLPPGYELYKVPELL